MKAAPGAVGVNALLHRLEVDQQVLCLEAGLAKANVHIACLVGTVLHLAALEVLDGLKAEREQAGRSPEKPVRAAATSVCSSGKQMSRQHCM